MFCTNCGAQIKDDALFCTYCGTQVKSTGQNKPRKSRLSIITIPAVFVLIAVCYFILGRYLHKNEIEDGSLPQGKVELDESDSFGDIYHDFAYENSEQELTDDLDVDIFDRQEDTALIEEEIEASQYILPNSDAEYLSRSDLVQLTQEDCRLARNELYARHGRKFDDEGLQEYFNSKDWYYGYIDPQDFSESVLNEFEIANRDLIVLYEEEMGYR